MRAVKMFYNVESINRFFSMRGVLFTALQNFPRRVEALDIWYFPTCW